MRHLFVVLLLSIPVLAQVPPETMRGYGINCFCNIPGTAPEEIIRMGSNWAILLAAQHGATRAQLKAGGATESQLQLLVDWNLLTEQRDGRLITAIPILDRGATARLRAEVREAARALLPELRPELQALLQQLRGIHRERTAFTILFSYDLDNMVWNDFYAHKVLTASRQLTPDHPFWAGVAWATDPAPPFRTGTNSDSDGNVDLNVNWSDAALPKLGPFLDGKSFHALMQEISRTGKISDPQLRRTFAPYDIADADGDLTVPVIVQREGDPLYESAMRLATAVSRAALAHLPPAEIQARYGLHDSEQALVISYHELMYALLDELVAEGNIQEPRIFTDPASARPADVGDLVFVLRLMH